MTKMRAEAVEAKVVLTDWNTSENICLETKNVIGKWCFETSGNDADIAAMPRPSKFPRWSYKWKLITHPASGVMNLQSQMGDLHPLPSNKGFLKKMWPERPRFPLSTSYPDIN